MTVPGTVPLADLVARVRTAIVGVSAGASSGSGYVARASGIVATTHRAVGYQLEALLDVDDGRKIAARVISVDVARGVAFLLPKATLGIAALRPADGLRLGDQVLALGRPRGQPLAIAPGIVCALASRPDAQARLRVDASLGLGDGGCPIVDRQGRVIGLSTGGAGDWLVTAAGYERDLGALDLPAAQLAERGPSYVCPSCDSLFSVELDRCLGCGVMLPHASPGGSTPIPGERAAKDILATLGVLANKVRVGPRTWRVARTAPGATAPTHVTIHLDEAGQHVVCRVGVARVPAEDHDALYRLLLTLNDQTTGLYHLSIGGDPPVVALSFSEPTALLRERDVAALFQDLIRNADHFRFVLAEAFGAFAPDDG